MPDMPKLVTIDLRSKKLLVDGAEFPWYINEDGLTVNNLFTSVMVPSVTVTFFPKDVEVDSANKKLLVDGQEFPWLISEKGPTLNNLDAPDALTGVTLTFYVRDIEVIPESPFPAPTALSLNEMSERLGWPELHQRRIQGQTAETDPWTQHYHLPATPNENPKAMRLRILELPMRHLGQASETPFALIIDRCNEDEAEALASNTGFAHSIGAVGALVFEHEVTLTEDDHTPDLTPGITINVQDHDNP
ncbi:hypothetical protein ACQPXH_19155 [Nocardia sp. CA-135953]|uniref:hypothetical protein n=1 Tax=Nocardia sp. CA-135953 TaxID=3239978 RepID=UPI003D9847E1